LSSAVAASNIQNLTPVVAQVTPRQVPQLHLPHSPFRANLSVAATSGNSGPILKGWLTHKKYKLMLHKEHV
jgi:hypothetical protein